MTAESQSQRIDRGHYRDNGNMNSNRCSVIGDFVFLCCWSKLRVPSFWSTVVACPQLLAKLLCVRTDVLSNSATSLTFELDLNSRQKQGIGSERVYWNGSRICGKGLSEQQRRQWRSRSAAVPIGRCPPCHCWRWRVQLHDQQQNHGNIPLLAARNAAFGIPKVTPGSIFRSGVFAISFPPKQEPPAVYQQLANSSISNIAECTRNSWFSIIKLLSE